MYRKSFKHRSVEFCDKNRLIRDDETGCNQNYVSLEIEGAAGILVPVWTENKNCNDGPVKSAYF